MTEKEKILAAMIHDPPNEGLKTDRIKRHNLCAEFNSLKENDSKRKEILKKLFPNADESFSLMSPCHFDNGYNIHIGKNSFANFNFTVLDTCEVIIGTNAKIGRNCVIGMGSVVTRDIPDGYLAFENPCKPIRMIDENDSIYLKKRLFEK